MQIIVIGGGVAGLGASLGLARAGHSVTLLERDATPFPANPIEAFANWDRRGAPQVRHSHAFLARLRNILRDRLPDVLEALLAEGTEELSISSMLRSEIDDASPRPGDDDLTLLACRRITFEWVLHRAVLNEPGITYRDGCTIRGVLASDGVVTGVKLGAEAGAEEVRADLVVDAAGRRSKLPAWLEAAGFAKPDEESEPCGIFYCSRFYQLRDDVASPERESTIGGDIGYLKYAVFHGDGRIFSVTFAAAPEDKPLRQLLRTEPFEAAARSLPATSRWVDPAVAEPITEVHAMDGLRNTRRFPIREDEVLAPGVIAIGDAAIHTNPLYGRGCSLALVHAYLLIDAITAHPGDLDAIAKETEAGVEREIVPWYSFAVAQDREAAATARRQREDTPTGAADESDRAADGVVDPRAYMRDVLTRGLIPALRLDATVLRAFMRSFNLLDPPGDLLQRPDILQRVLAVYQSLDQREEPVLGPGRDEFIAMLGQPPQGESNHV